MNNFISLTRLAIAATVLTAIFVPLYFFVLHDGAGDSAVAPAVLRETPRSASTAKVGLETGDLAPDFEISTTDGRRVRLSDFRGRPVVLNFFALWCTSCLTEMPEIKAAQEDRGLDAFAVIAVNAGESRQRALEFVDFLDAPFTYGLDTTLVVSDAYRVYGLPATVFIDAGGIVQTYYAGYTGRERLDAFLDAAIDARPPGDLPVVLRLISTIPRDRTMYVQDAGANRLKLTSRSLRCDAGYCAGEALDKLKLVAGIVLQDVDLDDAQPSVTLKFDPAVITRAQVLSTAVQAIESLDDPVYQGPVTAINAGS